MVFNGLGKHLYKFRLKNTPLHFVFSTLLRFSLFGYIDEKMFLVLMYYFVLSDLRG